MTKSLVYIYNLHLDRAFKKVVWVQQCQSRCNFARFAFVTQWVWIDDNKTEQNKIATITATYSEKKTMRRRRQHQNKTKQKRLYQNYELDTSESESCSSFLSMPTYKQTNFNQMKFDESIEDRRYFLTYLYALELAGFSRSCPPIWSSKMDATNTTNFRYSRMVRLRCLQVVILKICCVGCSHSAALHGRRGQLRRNSASSSMFVRHSCWLHPHTHTLFLYVNKYVCIWQQAIRK